VEDTLGDMYADEIQIDYSIAGASADPSKIILKGNVKMLNRFDGHVQESGAVLQYALADYAEYYPASKEMALSGTGEGRVLFYDKVNNIRMSAPSLKIKHDEKSPKGSVQGFGDVRFTFIENEFDQLRKHFQFKDQPK
jgi:hypothetical protein